MCSPPTADECEWCEKRKSSIVPLSRARHSMQDLTNLPNRNVLISTNDSRIIWRKATSSHQPIFIDTEQAQLLPAEDAEEALVQILRRQQAQAAAAPKPDRSKRPLLPASAEQLAKRPNVAAVTPATDGAGQSALFGCFWEKQQTVLH